MTKSEQALNFASRAFLSAIFIGSGIDKLRHPEQTAQYMKAYHLPLIPIARPAASAVEILAGLGILTGYRARLSASVLLAYLLPTTLIFHRFWSEPEEQKQMQQINFMKNHAIMGGLMQIALHGTRGAQVFQSTQRAQGLSPSAQAA